MADAISLSSLSEAKCACEISDRSRCFRMNQGRYPNYQLSIYPVNQFDEPVVFFRFTVVAVPLQRSWNDSNEFLSA